MDKDVKAFLKIRRRKSEYRPVCERVKDYKEVISLPSSGSSEEQSLRCMDCGTPFCHWACPVGSYIPEWNDLVSSGNWRKALELLEETNSMPEVTGRVCPAPCEYGCVLGINDDPVAIRENELSVIEKGFATGAIKPIKPKKRSGKKVAVIGSGPAGLSAAVKLNRSGHSVVVFEKDEKIGGIMRFGIPDFKLDKGILDRRIDIWKKEGLKFKTKVNVGIDYPPNALLKDFDAVCLAIGAGMPRDLNIEGRNLRGIHFAMDFLTQNNRRLKGARFSREKLIDAKDKRVVVIGGGDTGSDCVGTAHRQGASCVVQIEIMPQPPECRTENYPWPRYPLLLKMSSSHQEGGQRLWSVLTKEFMGEDGEVKKLSCVQVEFINQSPVTSRQSPACPVMREIPGSEFEIEADLVILAIGFTGPQKQGLVKDLKLSLDAKGNIKTDYNYMTSKRGVFAAGDGRRGQSLVAWAIYEGHCAAYNIDTYLSGFSNLPKL